MKARIAIATLAGVLTCGLPLWPLRYREVQMGENPSAVVWLALGTGAALLAGWLLPRWRLPVLSITAGFVIAVLLRVQVETMRDPTTHNLWPFEVAIAGFFGCASSLAGVAMARLIQRAMRSNRAA